MANNNSGSRNELLVRGAEQALDQMKYEIAQEFGVQLGCRYNSSCKRICWWRNYKTFSSNGRTTTWW